MGLAMSFDSLIRQLGEETGTGLSLSETGTCGVIFGDNEVDFEEYDGRLFIYASIGPCEGREDLFAAALAANHLGADTGFAALGIDTTHGVFTLSRVLEGDIDYQRFQYALVAFVEALQDWKTRLIEAPSPAAETASSNVTGFMQV